MRLKFYCTSGRSHPVVGQVWHRIAEAEGPESERYTRYVCNTLSSVARSPEECTRIEQELVAVQAGRLPAAEIEGEEVTLHVTQQGVRVDIEINRDWVNNPEGAFSLSEYLAAVRAWREFLLAPLSQSTEMLVELAQ